MKINIIDWCGNSCNKLNTKAETKCKLSERLNNNDNEQQTLSKTAHVHCMIYLWREVVCFVVMRSTKPRCFVSLECSGQGGMRRDAWAWFHGIWTCSAKLLEYWMIFSLKIKLNRGWKFQRNWNVHLVLLEISWWAGFNGIYLVRFGFRMWEVLIFKWFLSLKIQINSKKPGFGRKNQLRMW
jgi:hypothetical protein